MSGDVHRAMAGVVALGLTMVACSGGATPGEEPGPTAGPAPAEVALRVYCDHMDLGTPDDVRFPEDPLDGDALDALEEALVALGSPTEEEYFAGYDWSVAEGGAARMILFGRPLGPEADRGVFGYANLAVGGDGWALEGWGGCRPQVYAAGYGPATAVLDPEVEPATSLPELNLWIVEQTCASGQAPTGREIVPVVVEDESQVTVTIVVEPVGGDADCPDNPWVPLTVDLDAPLGERAVFDGGTVPPVRLAWPPNPDTLAEQRHRG